LSHTSRMHIYYNSYLTRMSVEKANRKSIRMERLLRKKLGLFSKLRVPKVPEWYQKVLSLTGSLFFVSSSPFARSIGVMSMNLKAVMVIALRTTSRFQERYGSAYTLELVHLHSFQKGEGKKLMEAFLSIQQDLDVPGSVWVEEIETVSYYEQFGFRNVGQLGSNEEFLMIVPASNQQ